VGVYPQNIGRRVWVFLSSAKTLLVNLQNLDFGIEGRLRDSELSCSSSRARDPALAFRQRRLDHFSFLCSKLVGKRLNRRIGACRLSDEPTFIDAKILRLGNDHGALDYILQFADISRPPVGLQELHALLGDARDLLSSLAGIAIDKVLHQQRNILLSFPKGGTSIGKTLSR
jgi:hypothetical protein